MPASAPASSCARLPRRALIFIEKLLQTYMEQQDKSLKDCTLAGFGSMTTASCPAPSKGRLVPRTCPVDCAAALATWRACAGSAAVIGQADAALDGQLTPFVGIW